MCTPSTNGFYVDPVTYDPLTDGHQPSSGFFNRYLTVSWPCNYGVTEDYNNGPHREVAVVYGGGIRPVKCEIVVEYTGVPYIFTLHSWIVSLYGIVSGYFHMVPHLAISSETEKPVKIPDFIGKLNYFKLEIR